MNTKKGYKISTQHKERISKAMKGKRNAFKNKRYLNPNGYIVFTDRINHTTYEHRWMVEKHLGRSLKANEVVHHINGNKSDNRIENLIVLKNNSENLKEYHKIVKKALEEFRKK